MVGRFNKHKVIPPMHAVMYCKTSCTESENVFDFTVNDFLTSRMHVTGFSISLSFGCMHLCLIACVSNLEAITNYSLKLAMHAVT